MGVTIRVVLARLRACQESREWAARRRSPTKAWAECPDGAWLAWVLVRTARTDTERREALGVVCAVVREIVPPRDPASERALSLAEAWCRGEQVTRNDLSAAADKAFAFSAHSYVAYSADSAEAAVDETVTVYAAEAAADSAAAISYASADAAPAYAADADARAAAAAYAAAADAIRRRLPNPPAWVLSACEVPA